MFVKSEIVCALSGFNSAIQAHFRLGGYNGAEEQVYARLARRQDLSTDPEASGSGGGRGANGVFSNVEGGVYQHGAGKVRFMGIKTRTSLLRNQLDCSRAVETFAPLDANNGKGYMDDCGDYLPKLKECPAGSILDPVDECGSHGQGWPG